MYGAGTGTLLRYEGSFFLLMPSHVLHVNMGSAIQNESPLWTHKRHPPKQRELHDMLFARRWYDIGPFVESAGIDWTVNVQDVILVELFWPLPPIYPWPFIDLDDPKFLVIPLCQFFEGQLLLVNGYPHRLNTFDHFDEPRGQFTHSTNIIRHSKVGTCKLDKGEPWISFQFTDGNHTPEDIDGMSGGVVCNVEENTAASRWAGMACTAGQGMCRFIPAQLLVPAIKRYRAAQSVVLDPASLLEEQSITREKRDILTQSLFSDYPPTD